MSLTTDPKDPRLGHGADTKPVPQNEVYLVLSEEERAKGYVRPVRRAYQHVGPPGPEHPLRDLTPEEHELYDQYGYHQFEAYPQTGEHEPLTGKYWTKEELERVGKGCGAVTTMGQALAETYARNPHFYGSTYCCACSMHRPVNEFVWDGTDQRVGS